MGSPNDVWEDFKRIHRKHARKIKRKDNPTRYYSDSESDDNRDDILFCKKSDKTKKEKRKERIRKRMERREKGLPAEKPVMFHKKRSEIKNEEIIMFYLKHICKQ